MIQIIISSKVSTQEQRMYFQNYVGVRGSAKGIIDIAMPFRVSPMVYNFTIGIPMVPLTANSADDWMPVLLTT